MGIAGGDKSRTEQYRHWLEDRFHSIRVTEFTQAAIERLDTTSDVLILDCVSTNGSGSEPLTRIDIYCLRSPTVLVTSQTPPATPTTDQNIAIWLSAPIDATTLTRAVEQLYVTESYGEVLDWYLSLAKQRAEIDTTQSTDTVPETPTYQLLMSKLDQIRDIAEAHRDQVTDQFGHRVFEYIDS